MAQAHVNKLVLAVTLVLLAAPGFASEFEVRLAEAERLTVQAAEAGYEWLETANLIQQARDAAAKGNLDDATALIEKARFQAETAIKQAAHEAEAWRVRVVR